MLNVFIELYNFRWFASYFSNVIPYDALQGIWDILIAGELQILGYVGLSLLLSLKRKILSLNSQDLFDQLIVQIEKYVDANAVVNTAINLWERPILDRMNKEDIVLLPK